MDPIQQEDPDAKPKRLVVLAGAGMVVATGFATVAAMVLSSQQHDGASPDASLTPTSSMDEPASTNLSYRLPPTDRLARTTSSQPGWPISDSAPTSTGTSAPGESSPDGPPLPPGPPAPPLPPDPGNPPPSNPEPTPSPPDLPGPTDSPNPPEPPEPTQPPSSSHPTPSPTGTSTETTGYSSQAGSSEPTTGPRT